jgi:imidazoleglycerol-phosphate dehydratase
VLDSFLRHSGLELCISATDLKNYDDHHVVEDVAITLGRYINGIFKEKLKDRFAWSLIPMDDVLALCAMDVSGRGYPVLELNFKREEIGGLALENVSHFFETLSIEGKFNLHLKILNGSNEHHKVEALFKALGVCIGHCLGTRQALASTKGLLDL